MPDQPPTEKIPGQVTVVEVHAEFENLLKNRTHVGLRNFLGDTFLEPRNPFERTSRQAKKWVVVIGGISLLGLLIVYGFHVR